MTAGPAATVTVSTSRGSYPVILEPGLRHRIPGVLGQRYRAARYAFVSDDTVADLYTRDMVDACRARGMDAELFDFPPGEASKTRAEWVRLTDALLEAGYGRDASVVAVGGGVTGDLAGFVAATFLRGIPVVQVPTSLVAMIDSSVGGKTGVDVPAGKNLVGAFHPPRAVLVDPEVVDTLPVPERAQGMAEAVKHGAILDHAYVERLEHTASDLLAGAAPAVLDAVRTSIELKASVVAQDEREAGVRQILNFGHTLGHALESASGYALGHGSAVALGMILEAEVGERMGVTRAGTRAELERVLGAFGLGTHQAPRLDVDVVCGYLYADKKTRAGVPRFVLLRSVGAVADDGAWSRPVEDALVRNVLADLLPPG